MADGALVRSYGSVFDQIADEYDRHRPAYPDALIDRAAEVGYLRCDLYDSLSRDSPKQRRTVAATTEASADHKPMVHGTETIIQRHTGKSICAWPIEIPKKARVTFLPCPS